MNILLVSGPGISLKEPYDSGIEAFIVSLANELVEQGHRVDVIAGEAESDVKFNLVNPFRSIFLSKSYFFKGLIEKHQFKSLDTDIYDVVHYNMFYPHLMMAGLHFCKQSVLTLHSPADKNRVRAYTKLATLSDITFVSISSRIKQQWNKALGLHTNFISNGIDTRLWNTHGPRNGKYLLWAARINEEKNVRAAINLAKYMQLPLKIAGRIADQKYFNENVKPHLSDRIAYVGHVTQQELCGLAKNASSYLATATWQEPFGLAALEMLASGVPVVGFNTAVPPDWAHESVLTTPEQHWESLAELVLKSNAVSSESCRQFASSMDIKNMTASYVEFYSNLLYKNAAIYNAKALEDVTSPIDSPQLQEIN
ncbi:glycosyltransferase family 4 protein [Mucilaginibacter pallidiroseus]|uniref:Glycosyltransferase family 4 protein n=1 Tax=Mucilaginibacter pallidiroseus TaxID=2599295 RepID=A0A563U3G9_9SPHI|nr:glycosyltransferase [Mucilaginibacter pallidiroseus]TWR25899.1 glycosyltransferase family 4 protein [Mucilaginibacter pallidiroseus]